jgi:hypothetical protein
MVQTRARREASLMPRPEAQEPQMSATDARQQLHRLHAERLDAVDAGLSDNELYMGELESDIAASHAAYVALAVTEIATLRAQLSGPQLG